jgi:hypothetical protein
VGLLEVLELAAEGGLGEGGHRKADGGAGQVDDGVTSLLEEVGGDVKGGPDLP